jgi:hypothetical protein
MKQSRRVSPRVPYDEAICLVRVDGRGRLYVRGIDLSMTGVYVVSAESCPVGTEVRCSLLLPGGPRNVRGRLVRVSALARGLGLAIEFVSLELGVANAIAQLITTRTQEVMPAKLRVDGVDHALRCQAQVHDGKVRLTATLPFLRLDGDVDVLLGEDGAVSAGVISKIALDPSADGVPRLAVEVELDGPGPRPTRRATRAYAVDESSPPPTKLPPACGHPLPSVLVAPGIERDVRRAEERPPRRRVHGTAEVARRPQFPDWAWSAPPARTAQRRVRPTARVDVSPRHDTDSSGLKAAWRWMRS